MSRRSVLRLATLGLAAIPATEMLTGCGSADALAPSGAGVFGVTPPQPLEVVIFGGGFGDEYAKTHEAMYRARFPRATVTHVLTKKIHDDLAPRFADGTPPDVVNNDGANQFTIGELVNDGSLVDLTELLDAPSYDNPKVPVRNTLMPGTVESGTFNGKVYALNYAYTVWGLFHDAALWQRNGWEPPKSWDDFIALASKIKASGVAPWTHAGKYPYYMGWPVADWIHKIGGPEVAIGIDNLEPNAWRTDAVRTALDMVIELVRRGFVMPGSDTINHTDSQQAVIDGHAAMLPCGTWLENEMKATLPGSVKLTIVPVWSASGSDRMPYGSVRAGAMASFVVPTMARNKAGGLEYLRMMLSRAGASKFAQSTHSLASVKGSADSVTGSTALTSAATVMHDAGTNLIGWKFNDWYAAMDKAWQGAIAEVMAGTITQAGTFVATMQAAADAVARDSSITKFHRDK